MDGLGVLDKDFSFVIALALIGFVYAIAQAACEFLYLRNNEYYELKKKKKKKKKKT